MIFSNHLEQIQVDRERFGASYTFDQHIFDQRSSLFWCFDTYHLYMVCSAAFLMKIRQLTLNVPQTKQSGWSLGWSMDSTSWEEKTLEVNHHFEKWWFILDADTSRLKR